MCPFLQAMSDNYISPLSFSSEFNSPVLHNQASKNEASLYTIVLGDLVKNDHSIIQISDVSQYCDQTQ